MKVKKNLVRMITLSTLFVVLSACSSTDDRKETIIKGAATCNSVCKDNPEISEFDAGAGGGFPLLMMGGMKFSCRCFRQEK